MSEVKAYRIDECARMVEDSEPDEDSWIPWTAAQSELAALREELAEAKRTAMTEILALNSTLKNQAKELAAAEQRNAELVERLQSVKLPERKSAVDTFSTYGLGEVSGWNKCLDALGSAFGLE